MQPESRVSDPWVGRADGYQCGVLCQLDAESKTWLMMEEERRGVQSLGSVLYAPIGLCIQKIFRPLYFFQQTCEVCGICAKK